MLSALPILLTLPLAAPYADTQGRFSLTLVDGWGLAPRFGSTGGMRFSRKLPARRGGGLVYLEVQVEARDGAEWAQASWDRLQAAGYRLRPGSGRVGGEKTRRFTATRADHRVRCDFVLDAASAARICVEAAPADLLRVRRDVKAMLRSFRMTSAGAEAAAPAPVAAPSNSPPPPPRVAGRYRSDVGTELELGGDGRYRLGSSQGRYRVQDGLLVLEPEGGRRVQFSFVLDGDALTLTSDRLERPAVYRRRGGPAARAAPARIAGRWRAERVELELKVDGTFVLGDAKGKWVYEAETLRLRHEKGAVVSYDAKVSQDDLLLSGADLDQPVSFRRKR